MPPSPNEPDLRLIDRLEPVKRICLGVAALIAFLNFCVWMIPNAACAFSPGMRLMSADCAAAAFLCAISLHLSEHQEMRPMRQFSLILAALVAIHSAALLTANHYRIVFGLDAVFSSECGSAGVRMASATAAAFGLTGISILLVDARRRSVVRLADLVVCAQGLMVLILVTGYLFGALRIFGLASVDLASPQTLLCLTLLTLVTLLRRAEKGLFSIFLGHGIGSRIARVLIPVMLALPFLREAGRARLVRIPFIPVQYATAVLASVATAVSLGLLLFLAWRINSMEGEIHELSLRDDVTGLYNLRGFSLLADQALRMAQRSRVPFSVLYIDFDNLKQVNDSLGHHMGSWYLSETGHVLKATFRETDVMGRIGGDEFAVAGHFSRETMTIAVERLRAACAAHKTEEARPFPLSLSVGHVSATENGRETLKELLIAADRAMYEEKRRKKAGRA